MKIRIPLRWIAGFCFLVGISLWLKSPVQRESLLSKQHRILTISDRLFGGASRVEIVAHPSGLGFRYGLSPEWNHPWAGINLGFSQSVQSFLDLTRWEGLELKARSTPMRALRIQLLSDDLPRPGGPRDSLHPIYHAQEFIPDGQVAVFRWSAFSIPAWWNAQNSRSDLQRLELLDRLRAVEFHSGDSPSGKDSALVQIDSLDLVRPNPLWVWTGRILSGIGLALLAITLLPGSRASSPPVASALVPQPVTLENPRSRQSAQLLQSLRQCFSDPDLSLEKFASQQGMSPRLVASLLKEATQLHFKGAVNELRLTEAARLLGQSQANISEIAFAVGFQNLSHFGRAFREKFGVSPSEFRSGKNQE